MSMEKIAVFIQVIHLQNPSIYDFFCLSYYKNTLSF